MVNRRRLYKMIQGYTQRQQVQRIQNIYGD